MPVEPKHANDIFREFTPQVAAYMARKVYENKDEVMSFIASAHRQRQTGESLRTIITKKDTGEFIGGTGIVRLNTRTPELGVWIKTSAHGNEYGREAVTALKAWADEHIDYDHLIFPVDKRNVASRKIAESLGGVIKKEYTKKNPAGETLDEVEYWIEHKAINK